jgi:DNA-binding PucR family transcriptional regulator
MGIDDLGVAALLLSHGDTGTLQRFADQLLAPLDDLDEARRDELIETLDVWLQEDHSTSKSAARLLVHPNTVGYRLKTLEDRLGRSLRDHAFLVDLQMALAIAQVAGAKPS